MIIFYIVKKYVVFVLEVYCVEFFIKYFRVDNVFMLFIQVWLFDEFQLVSFCLDIIDKSIVDVISVEGFIDIDIDIFCVVLERDILSI